VAGSPHRRRTRVAKAAADVAKPASSGEMPSLTLRWKRVVAVAVRLRDLSIPVMDLQFGALVPADLACGIDGLLFRLKPPCGAVSATPEHLPIVLLFVEGDVVHRIRFP
jgi:hypothetical protein